MIEKPYRIVMRRNNHDVICAGCGVAVIGQCFDARCDEIADHSALDLPCDDCDPEYWQWDWDAEDENGGKE